jgi:hypothetical protein
MTETQFLVKYKDRSTQTFMATRIEIKEGWINFIRDDGKALVINGDLVERVEELYEE